MSCPARIYPLRKPANHQQPVPRWQVVLPKNTTHVYTAYIGVQQRSDDQAAAQACDQVVKAILAWLATDDGPSASEFFTVVDGSDVIDTAVWVCYWTEADKYERSTEALSIHEIYQQLAAPGHSWVGIWRESFVTEALRLETNHSGLDYLPGLARLPGASTEEHTLATYWGAARDRIPDSAYDLFPPAKEVSLPESAPVGKEQYLVGTNPENLVHIRSGQFWENCGPEEVKAYESKLEPTLLAGLGYLWDNPRETGAYGLRYLRNADPTEPTEPASQPRKETCGAGFFASLETLEEWAKQHRSHLAIYRGALAHYKVFGDTRRLRTWHEVSVLRAGDARFEYVNCVPRTGVIGCIALDIRDQDV
ncbi:hypothetical protein GQ53DRAFT_510073 [Thozetella sp. PMI_491]|nr:hypothetical protein GQ53DRAFT_510073 [Thozetella sp. PMI_491]